MYIKKRRPAVLRPATLSKIVTRLTFADLRAGEAAVLGDPHPATAEEVRHSGYRLFGVFGAGADGDDQITERKWAGLEDLSVLFHRVEPI